MQQVTEKRSMENRDNEFEEEEEAMKVAVPDRGTWSGKFDFILACLGTAVGLGNVWRFPYLCYRNGGGAFVIPYVIMVFVIGLPIFLLELSLGQYSGLGPSKVFENICPAFRGLGYAMLIVASIVAIYYNMIIAWTLFYFFDSFRSVVDWQFCNHDFNTDKCFSDKDLKQSKPEDEGNAFNSSGYFLDNMTENVTNAFNSSGYFLVNMTENVTNAFNSSGYWNNTLAADNYKTDIALDDRISAPEEYFNRYMLEKSSGIEDIGNIRWQLALCLLTAWVIVVVCLIKGIKSSGKVVYFTATFPYLILFILFIRGITLEGAIEGLKFYAIPDFQKLKEVKVWQDAAIQVFYSFSIGGGGMMTYASYNKFNNNLIRDVWIIGMGDMLTSLFSGVVVFSMIGFMAGQLGKSVPDVIQSGTGLAFIVYPDGISRMPVSTLWALLFFFMLFLLGIDSQFAVTETIITFIFDQFPKTRSKKPIVVTAVGVVLFLLGLPLCTRGGIYILELMDTYAAGWPYLIIGMLECIIISYIYGIERFLKDVKEMTGWYPGGWTMHHLCVTIMTIAPGLMAFLLLLGWIDFEPLKLGDYVFPTWGNDIGLSMAFIPVAVIPIAFIITLFTSHLGFGLGKRLEILTTPTDAWSANARLNAAATKVTEVSVINNKAEMPLTPTENGAYSNHGFSMVDYSSKL